MYKKHRNSYFLILLYGLILIFFFLGNGNLYGSMVDWLSQHSIFPDTFRQAFYESGQLFPNFLFHIGGGQNIFHFVYYGFLSPGILLSYLLPFVDMTTYIMYFSICSYLASGCLIYRFLSTHFEEDSFFKNIAFWGAILFLSLPPITYHFHHHIMFVWFLPFFLLALMGLDNCFFSNRKHKYLFFIASVCGMIMTNYYFSVGGLVFLFIYTVYNILKTNAIFMIQPLSENSDKPNYNKSYLRIEKTNVFILLKQIGEYILLFLIPVFLCGFMLLPTAYTLFSNERTSNVSVNMKELFIPAFREYFYDSYSMGISAIMLLAIMGNLTYTIWVLHHPMEYCSNIHSQKENASVIGNKIVSSVVAELFLNIFLLFVLICPFFLYLLNGMLYVRGKVLIACSVLFLYNFCLFLQKIYKNPCKVINHWLPLAMKFSIGFIALLLCLRKSNWKIGVCLLIEFAMIWFFKNWKPTWVLYPVIISVLISYQANIMEETYVPKNYYEQMYHDEIEALLIQTEDTIYRTNIMYRENYMANKIYGKQFYGTSIYSSTYNQRYQQFYENYMGNNERYRNCFITAGGRSELFHTFMGTKYMIAEKDPGLYYEEIVSGQHLNLYKNTYA